MQGLLKENKINTKIIGCLNPPNVILIETKDNQKVKNEYQIY